MSVEYQSAIEELAQVLANRFARLARGWEASTPGKRQDDLENILAARNVAAKLQDLVTESDAVALPVSEALMNAAQVCSNRRYTWHHSQEECQAGTDAGYPYGFGDNLTVFTGTEDAAQHALDN